VRTTINLDDDVAREVDRLRRERGLGLSQAVNELARAGFHAEQVAYVYEHPTRAMGALVDVANVADVLELLDDVDRPASGHRADPTHAS
jgi:metal-responsive CopG/Arc/MetJ family transcriptional regulator